MSRVADAFRKSHDRTDGAATPLLAPHFGDPDSRWCPALPAAWSMSEPLTESPEVAGSAAPAGIPVDDRQFPRMATNISDQELMPLIQRLFEPAAAAARIRSVLFSAIAPRTAPEHLSAAAADALARRTSASVCLVDADLHRPVLHELFGVGGRRGLSDLLLERGDPRNTLTQVRRNLWLLPGGSRPADAVAHLGTEQLRPCLVELLRAFEYVIVDAPLAGAQPDPILLARLVDGVVLVVEANATRREIARKLAKELQAAHVEVLGAVLTNRTFPIPERLYRRL